jgi:hypothetical protein
MKDVSQIHYIKGFMPAEVADKLSKYSVENDADFNEFGNNEKEFTVNVFKNIDQDTQDARALATEWGMKVYEFVTNSYSGEFKPFEPQMTHIARFEPGWGMHEHFDASKPNDIATLIYLNNDYDGGEIYFPEYDISYKPEPGDLLTFPDNPDYVHGVKAVAGGIRYTTPRWFTRIV